MTPAPPYDDREAVVERRAQAVRLLRCADLVDALGRIDRHHAHILDLVTPTPGRVLFGPAATISYFPSCSAMVKPESHNFGALFRQAVGVDADDAGGTVLVLASNGCRDTSVGGVPSLPCWRITTWPVSSPMHGCVTSMSCAPTRSRPAVPGRPCDGVAT
ncbi:hypothetical protein [Streptomyces sp. NPDC052012]|uniref:hypothetical protein n=1 Tax=Streptomyces sp. NPDC052012 TaxID=3155051 RepID=UPI00344DE01F